MMTQADFLARIEAHLAKTKQPPSRFGLEAIRDPNFVFDLRRGRSTSLVVVARVMKYMNERENAAACSKEETAA